VTRSERKLADMSLSAMSLKLEAGEIEHAVRLHDILWDWLSYRRKDPVLDVVSHSLAHSPRASLARLWRALRRALARSR
jgi:hypothetical protein